MPVIPFSYNYVQFLEAGGETLPGIELYNSASYNLEGYLVQARGIVPTLSDTNNGFYPGAFFFIFTDSAPFYDPNFFYQGLANIILLSDIYNPTIGWASPPFFKTPYPELITLKQMDSLNVPSLNNPGTGEPNSNTPLNGKLCLFSTLDFIDKTNFLVQGFVKVS